MMDEVDMRIIALLLPDSRRPYRELADALGLSLQAVHRRVQQLESSGIIASYRSDISLSYLNPMVAYIFGTTGLESVEEAFRILKEDDRSYIVLISDRNYLTIGALPRDMADLGDYTDKVSRELKMRDMRVGLANITHSAAGRIETAGKDKPELSPLDCRIILAMHENARKSVEEVAMELKVSASTVRRRLERMVENKLVDFTLEFHPSASGAHLAQVYVTAMQGVDKLELAKNLLSKNEGRMVFFVTFSNLPDLLLLGIWGNTLKEVKDRVAKIASEPGVAAAYPNMIHEEHVLPTWRDSLLRERASERKQVKKASSQLMMGNQPDR